MHHIAMYLDIVVSRLMYHDVQRIVKFLPIPSPRINKCKCNQIQKDYLYCPHTDAVFVHITKKAVGNQICQLHVFICMNQKQ